MVLVDFAATLKRYVGPEPVSVQADTVKTALEAVVTAHPELAAKLLDDMGELHRHVSVFLNNSQEVDRDQLSHPLKQGDELFVFQAIAGG